MKCPFCGKEINENSSFCIYCMKSLTKKTQYKRLQFLSNRKLVCFLSLLIGTAVIFVSCFYIHNDFFKENPDRNNTPSVFKAESVSSKAAPFGDNDKLNSDDLLKEAIDSKITSNTPSANVSDAPTGTHNIVLADNHKPPVYIPKNTSLPKVSYVPKGREADNMQYSYRNTASGYILCLGRVNTVPLDGVLFLPDLVDSKTQKNSPTLYNNQVDYTRIFGIDALLLTEKASSSALKVVIPKNIRIIYSDALVCKAATDIYLMGDSVYLEDNWFSAKYGKPRSVTLHCSENCKDERTGKLLKDIYKDYGFDSFEGWNTTIDF